MDAVQNLLNAFSVVLQPEYLLYALIGCLLGTAVGVLPGLGPTVTMALLLPVVYRLGDPLGTIIMFAGIFYGAMYGGSTTSILLSTPGESSSVVSAMDGYRMARSGRAGAALLTSAVGSFVAGIISAVGLVLVAAPLVRIALSFGPAEYFAFSVLALSTASMLGGRPLKAAFSVLFGLAVGTVGIHAVSGVPRLAYGEVSLYSGIDFELVTIGLLAVVEVFFVLGGVRTATRVSSATIGKLLMTRQEWRRSLVPWLRGSVLGFGVGALPGAGATVSTYLSYGMERAISRTPEKFGRGEGMIEGLAGPEAANNAATGGSMVPLLTLGIPASAATAVMLGALRGFGVPTGPLLLRDNADLVYAVLASFFVGNVMLLVLNLPMIGVWVRLLRVPAQLLHPMVLVLCTIGVFSLGRNQIDLYLMVGFALVGLLLRFCDFPVAPAILALVLGPLTEEQWGRALTGSQGDWTVFVGSPLAVVILVLAIGVATLPFTARLVGRLRRRGQR
jgi:putative tricarboxylic transport membrane protein